MKRTKIIATIGPASSDYKTLLEMAKSGMNVCRLNFSHNSHKSHLSLIKNINKVRRTLDIPLSIMQDLQGPKIRVGNVSDLGIKIEKNEKVVLIFEINLKTGFEKLYLTKTFSGIRITAIIATPMNIDIFC